MANYLVIAASSNIGQRVVELLREQGHHVITTARDQTKITPDIIVDATDFEAIDAVFENAGRLDGVLNCSGSLLLRAAHLTAQDQYQSVINASLTTAFATVRSAGKHMQQGGCVVLISSAAARVGLPNHEAIAAAKAGVEGLVLSAAATYASQKLRVNAVAPGLVETSLTASFTANELTRKASEAMHPLGRIGQVDDVARAILFFLDTHNDWITGQILGVDGGLATLRARQKS